MKIKDTYARKLFLVLTLALAVYTVPSSVQADAQLDAYRANGVIAERFDGYVETRDTGAPSEARDLVNRVNTKRRALYNRRAEESNAPVEEVGKLFAIKIIEIAPAGTYFRQPNGDYARK